jgi:hypothetical protein
VTTGVPPVEKGKEKRKEQKAGGAAAGCVACSRESAHTRFRLGRPGRSFSLSFFFSFLIVFLSYFLATVSAFK